jgi:tripartite-type tricarboxylate transporter receptor subunit TctC
MQSARLAAKLRLAATLGVAAASGLVAVLLAVAAMMYGATARAADDYPTHPVRWLVGYPPGAVTDVCARLIGQYLSEHLHQQFVIENKPGAGNNLATEMAAHAPPDGYTVLLVDPADVINATLYKDLSFNFLKDMAPVAGFIRVANVMEVNPKVPAKTVAEFIDYARAHPGKLNMASPGVGTSSHLSGALFMMLTGVKMVHVPYRGGAPALTDMMTGQDQVMFSSLPTSISLIHDGTLRALAVTTEKRDPALPDLPTVAETVKGYESSAFFGMAVPRGTPKPIIETLNKAVNQALADPSIKAKLVALGGTLIPGTPEDFGKLLTVEAAKWAAVIKATGLKAE